MKYETFRKRYPKAPEFAWIKKNFEVEGNSVEDVIKAVNNKLKKVVDYFEALLLGESYKTFVERSFLSEEDKKIVSKLYRELQVLLNEEFLISIEMNDKKKAEWLAKIKEFWNNAKYEIIDIVEKIIEGWKKRKKKIEKRETRYHW
ncbi:MAG TPA: hypothetical protein EYH56_00890 [Nanoarchaeota archaeon]|nr:hypothetical protein [Nanoarchaeota archaeon]